MQKIEFANQREIYLYKYLNSSERLYETKLADKILYSLRKDNQISD